MYFFVVLFGYVVTTIYYSNGNCCMSAIRLAAKPHSLWPLFMLASQIVTDGNSSYEDFLINPTLHEFSFNEIGEEDVVNVIDKLPSKTSSGVDGISTNLLKDIKYLISKPLTLIVNQCLETGIFPIFLKIAKVIPILKRGDETIFDNYRPIAILPSISKVFERIIFFMSIIYIHNTRYVCIIISLYGASHASDVLRVLMGVSVA